MSSILSKHEDNFKSQQQFRSLKMKGSDPLMFPVTLLLISVFLKQNKQSQLNNKKLIQINFSFYKKITWYNKSLTKLYHIMLYDVVCTSPWTVFEPTTLVVMGTDCMCNCKFYYHTTMTTTASVQFRCRKRPTVIQFIQYYC